MKQIIKGKRYDTETAVKCGSDYFSNPGDLYYWEETLYRKKTGEFFLYGEGGPASRYAECCGQGSYCGGSRIIPYTLKEAQEWAEEHLSGDEYEEIFGIVDEDESKITQVLRLSASTVELLKRTAVEQDKTISDVAESILVKALKE